MQHLVFSTEYYIIYHQASPKAHIEKTIVESGEDSAIQIAKAYQTVGQLVEVKKVLTSWTLEEEE